MLKNTAQKFSAALLVLSFGLGGCSWFESKDKSPIDLGAVGPSTKQQLKSLPKGLVGDDDNSLHTSEVLRGDEAPN